MPNNHIMKRKSSSYFEVKINDITIGYAVNLFYYNKYESDLVTTEFIPYGLTKFIEGIELNSKWQIYLEKRLVSPNQDEQQIMELVGKNILNLKDLKYEHIKHRQGFDLKLMVNENEIRMYLIHEFSISPNFKQIQLTNSEKSFRFEIDESDEYILDYVKQELSK